MSKVKVNSIEYYSGSFVQLYGLSAYSDKINIGENVTMNKDLHVGGNLNVVGTSTVSGGTLTLGDSRSGDDIILNASVASNIIPDDTDTYTLGTTGLRWSEAHILTAFIQGNLDLDGNAEIGGNTSITGNTTIGGNTTTTGDTSTSGTLNATGNTTLQSELTVSGASNLVGKTTHSAGADVTGDVNITGNQDTSGTAAISGATTIYGATDIKNTLNVTNATALAGTLSVTDAATLASTLDVTGNTTTGALTAATLYAGGADIITAGRELSNIESLDEPTRGTIEAELQALPLSAGNVHSIGTGGQTTTVLGTLCADTIVQTNSIGSTQWDLAYNQLNDSTTDINVDSGLLFVDKSENKVGINVTTPQANFHVRGEIMAGKGEDYGIFSAHNHDCTDNAIFLNSVGTSWLSGGNVGINTKNATKELTVHGAVSAHSYFVADASGTGKEEGQTYTVTLCGVDSHSEGTKTLYFKKGILTYIETAGVASPTPTPTPSITISISTTPSTSVTPSITPTASISVTPNPSISVTPTASVSVSVTPSISVTASVTPSVTPTPSC